MTANAHPLWRRRLPGRGTAHGLRPGSLGCDDGSTLLLTAFYSGLALVVILLGVSASSLYLERQRLFTAADGAALAGAESFELDDVEVDGDTVSARLDSAAVARAVDDYLGDLAPGEFSELGVDRADSPDGRSATVTLSAAWHPVLVSFLVPEGFRIDVTSVARSVFD